MTNDHFISIFIISCILLGIQSSVSAQSSDWVYSPYAQYLTNDTTIPPPVGEPADAALSCFRHDTIYALITPSGQLYIWLRPDPLMDKNIGLSPYVYCHANPLKYIDPDGRDDFFNEYGEYLEHIDNGTDYVMIRNTNGDVQNLIDFSYSKDNESNRAMLSNIASYYARTIGLDQRIEVRDIGLSYAGAFAATDVYESCQVYMLVANGKISPNACTSNNIMNSFVHEKDHVEKGTYGSLAEIYAIVRQICHPSWSMTTETYQIGIIGYLINNVNTYIKQTDCRSEYPSAQTIINPIMPILDNSLYSLYFHNDSYSIYHNDYK